MIDPKFYLDDSNVYLWKILNKSFHVNIEYCYGKNYGINIQNRNCTIYVPLIGEPDTASFTHELLHLYISSFGIHIGGTIKIVLNGRYPFDLIFDKDLYDHISNSLEHIKILPLYLDMGYPIENFISDYYSCKLTNVELDYICREYKNDISRSKYNRFAVNCFIGKFFAVKADVNPNNRYDYQMAVLDELDHKLFSALNKFWNSWIEYDIELKREVWEPDYHRIVDVLEQDLVDWSKNKIIA